MNSYTIRKTFSNIFPTAVKKLNVLIVNFSCHKYPHGITRQHCRKMRERIVKKHYKNMLDKPTGNCAYREMAVPTLRSYRQQA